MIKGIITSVLTRLAEKYLGKLQDLIQKLWKRRQIKNKVDKELDGVLKARDELQKKIAEGTATEEDYEKLKEANRKLADGTFNH